jgi:Ca2+-binding EF-hand superfamily protein
VPLTPFQKHKFRRMFSFLDLDGDGRVDRKDFLWRVETIARLEGWTRESPQYQRNLRFALEEWENLRESADANVDEAVTEDEFLRYAELFLTDRQMVRAYARGDAQLMLDAMDSDGDDRISLPEYRRYLEVCGAETSGAEAFFRHADLDEDGFITRAELAHAIEEFLLSDRSTSGGSYLFGPLGSDRD